jgi:hypothetical protein
LVGGVVVVVVGLVVVADGDDGLLELGEGLANHSEK